MKESSPGTGPRMEPRISLVTLGVRDLAASRRFYVDGLGWPASPAGNEHVVFLKTRGAVVSLYGRKALAEDATVPEKGSGFRGIALAHNVRTREEVASVLDLARRAGGTVVKPAQDVFWGGHSGYFADPDGHLWEVAWNPQFPLNLMGELELP